MVFVAKRVACRDILNSDDRGDVARVTGFDVFAFVRLNLNQPRNAFAFVRARIINGVAFAKACRNRRGRTRVCRQTDRSKV